LRFWAAVSTVEARRIVELRKPAEILVFSDCQKLAEKKIGANSPDRLEPATFQERLAFHIARHGETYWEMWKALVRPGERFSHSTLSSWLNGKKAPRSIESLNFLARVEERYGLPDGYFRALLPHTGRAMTGFKLRGIAASEQRRLVWHLPDDFNERPLNERREILDWVRDNIISGATEYRNYQRQASKHRYSIRFPELSGRKTTAGRFGRADTDIEVAAAAFDAPAELGGEMAALLRFKTSTLTDIGYRRNGVWGEETSSQRIEHLGLMFGALSASPDGPISGFGVPLDDLAFGHLVFPRIWDWYVQWRETRRGFYTVWEADMLRVAAALTRAGTGWIRQTPQLAVRLKPIPQLVSQLDIDTAIADWERACDQMYAHGLERSKEIARVARVHRDPFEPILPILEAQSPLAEYRKITEEIARRVPDMTRHPKAAAEAVRSFLMLRLGLHLGVRQKNLRQLLLCPKGAVPRSERQLETLKRGELRWNVREESWEVVIPAVAFKNAASSFFSGRPFRLKLPDLGGLYAFLEDYIERYRPLLLAGAADPGVFFIKTVKTTSQDSAYDQNAFYEAWRLTIQRYGIWNPYTGRGAVKGLLPHGPHNVRDVLATHILKQTGSYEQASYAIQDTPETVAKHYGRFLPQDKAALAAETLNKVWLAA
jgi:transcriptional regulator with XRE-family HTH domain